MTISVRIARWVDSAPVGWADLSAFRIIVSVAALLLWPGYAWLASYSGAVWDPPPGPFALLSGPPSLAILVLLDIGIRVGFGLLLFGVAVRPVGVVTTILMMVGEGLSFSLGKIDHTILFVLVPIVLAWSGWDRQYSVWTRASKAKVADFSLRLLAVIIGVAFFTSAVAKVRGGWLSLDTQATYAHQVQQTLGVGKDEWLAPFLPHVHVPMLWETLDWATILVEAAPLLCVFSWRAWRIALAVLTVFHFGVLLTFNIAFWMNVVVYAAFVPWSRIFDALKRGFDARVAVALALTCALAAWFLSTADTFQGGLAQLTVIVAAAFGIDLLVIEAMRVLRQLRRRGAVS